MADNSDRRADEIKALARDHAELAIETLVDVMQDIDAAAAAKVKAADIILNRGFGAPERKVEQKIDVNIYDERAAHLLALQKLGQKRKALPKPDPAQIEDAEIIDVTPNKEKSRNGNRS